MTDELDEPVSAEVMSFDPIDGVGKLQLASGEVVRFGRTACVDLTPTVGMQVFATALAPHPMGGRKATKLRAHAVTESALRAQKEEAEQAALAKAREEALLRTRDAMIGPRIQAALGKREDDDVDLQQLHALVDDLELVGAKPSHQAEILQAIAAAPTMTHFGGPGPLVHFLERSFFTAGPGYLDALMAFAIPTPTFQFFVMLMRLQHEPEPIASRAMEVVLGYTKSTHPVLARLAREALEVRSRNVR